MNVVPQSEFDVIEAEETGLTFVENAILKARNAAQHTGLPAIADDSGLEVDALEGAPGIYSARFAGVGASDQENLEKLLADLKAVPDEQRSARFQCLMVYMRHAKDPTPLIFQGTWEGRILHAPRGDNGFGYDPVFFVPTHNCSSAELEPDVKNCLSHRGQALRKLVAALAERPDKRLLQLPATWPNGICTMFNFKRPPPLSLYIHFPWCMKKCPYCDFNSHAVNDIPRRRLHPALLKDLDRNCPRLGTHRAKHFHGRWHPQPVFTRRLWNSCSAASAPACHSNQAPKSPWKPIPAAPNNSASPAYREAGINRLSIGIQSFQRPPAEKPRTRT